MEPGFGDEVEGPPQSVLRRYRVGIIVTGVVHRRDHCRAKMASTGGSSKKENFTLVSLAPPPPPPPAADDAAASPAAAGRAKNGAADDGGATREAPKNEPLGTGIKGDGPDSFGLSNKPGSDRVGPDGGRATKWRSYATRCRRDSAGAATEPQDAQRQHERASPRLARSIRTDQARATCRLDGRRAPRCRDPR